MDYAKSVVQKEKRNVRAEWFSNENCIEATDRRFQDL